MTKNYQKKATRVIIAFILFLGLNCFSQNVQFTFQNAQNTNDGVEDYYEADIMIQTIGGLADFKLGSGQIYFNYNTTAFGNNIFANGSFTVSADYGSGYFLGELAGFTNFYNINTLNDNTTSRVSWSFSQGVSSGAMTEVVSATARKLIHIKIKYADVNESPMITFEDNETLVSSCRDQFYTACGPFDSLATTLDCTADADVQNVSTQFLDVMFDSSNATLSNKDFELLTGLFLYPNPTKGMLFIKGDVSKLTDVNIYNLMGQEVMKVKGNFSEINISSLSSAMYFVKLDTEEVSGTYRVIKE